MVIFDRLQVEKDLKRLQQDRLLFRLLDHQSGNRAPLANRRLPQDTFATNRMRPSLTYAWLTVSARAASTVIGIVGE